MKEKSGPFMWKNGHLTPKSVLRGLILLQKAFFGVLCPFLMGDTPFLVTMKQLWKGVLVSWSVGTSVTSYFFGLLGATYAVYTSALFISAILRKDLKQILKNKAVCTTYVAPRRPKGSTYGPTDGPTNEPMDTCSHKIASLWLTSLVN